MIKDFQATPTGLKLVLLALLINAGLESYNVYIVYDDNQALRIAYSLISVLLAIGLFAKSNFVRVTAVVVLIASFTLQLFPVIIFSSVLMNNPVAGNDVSITLILKSIKLAITFGLLDYLTLPDTRIYFKQDITITDRARRPLFYFGMMGLTAGITALTLTGWTHTLLVFIVNLFQPILMVLG